MSVPGGFFAALRSSSGGPFPGASLYLNLLSGTSLDSRVTFSRGGNATLVDGTGRIVYAPANLLLRSEEFNDANWQKLFTSVTANTTAAPDNNTTADTLTASATTAEHVLLSAVGMGVSILAGVTYAISIYVKAGTSSFIQINGPTSFGADAFANFNVATGTVGTVGSAATASIQDVGNGWYRCSMVAPALVASGRVNFTMTTSATAPRQESWTATGTETLFIWGAQLEPVTYQTVPGPYVATTSAAYYGPRFDYNPVTLAPLGLLIEEQRVNLLTYSAQFDDAAWLKLSGGTGVAPVVTANAGVAPDGTTTADRVVLNRGAGTTSSDISRLFQNTGTLATVGMLSVWMRSFDGVSSYSVRLLNSFGELNVTVTPTWQRFSVVSTSTSTNAQIAVRGDQNQQTADVLIWGAQLEAGSFATSYIPTVASQVTRLADVANMTGTNFSSWYNQPEGTFFADFTFAVPQPNLATLPRFIGASDSAGLTPTGGTAITGYQRVGGTTQMQIALGTSQIGTHKAAMAYGAISTTALNGAAATGVTGSTAGSMNALFLGIASNAFHNTSGQVWYRQIAYFNTRLPNAQLEALTAPPLITSLSLDFLNGVYEG